MFFQRIFGPNLFAEIVNDTGKEFLAVKDELANRKTKRETRTIFPFS